MQLKNVSFLLLSTDLTNTCKNQYFMSTNIYGLLITSFPEEKVIYKFENYVPGGRKIHTFTQNQLLSFFQIVGLSIKKFSKLTQQDLMSKALRDWSPSDVGLWIGSLGPWANEQYDDKFVDAGQSKDGILLMTSKHGGQNFFHRVGKKYVGKKLMILNKVSIELASHC